MHCEPDFVPQFTDWYADKHTIDLLEAGFLSCQYYHCHVGYPNICNVYEIPGADLFSSNVYQGARKVDADRPAVLSHITDRSNTVYDPLCVLLPDQGGGTGYELPYGNIDAPAIALMLFDLEGQSESDLMTEAYDKQLVWPGTGGVHRVRLCRFEAKHPNNPRDPRNWVVLAECAKGSASDAAKALEDHLRHRFGNAISNIGTLIGTLSFRRVAP